MNKTTSDISIEEQKLWQLLDEVKDPEVPVLSIIDLGILRSVSVEHIDEKPVVCITITPTYSGCPAMDVISMDIRLKLIEAGYRQVHIRQSLLPVWTTDWMTERGRQKLKAFGIAPPKFRNADATDELFMNEQIACPHCGSVHTELLSQFSSTSCKAMYKCGDCKEVFDYFKCH